MTFTEAAIEVLRREGKPLHFRKIAEIAVRESLLDHIGKIPEEVMGGQLATHCRLPHADRKVVVVQPGTFALVEWGLDEDPAGLENLIEPPPEDEIPYRPHERHPIPSREVARGMSRGEARARRREEGEERRGRRYPPPAEVAYEILAGVDRPLTLAEIAAQGAERLLMSDAFVRDGAALAAALAEDNRRREAGGRKPLFAIDGEAVSLAAQPEPGERAAAPLAAARPAAVAAELRRSALAALRRRVRECDAATLEYVVARLLEATGLRELKVAKRSREHVVFTGRRKMGLAEVRHCIRILRGGGELSRREVTELRRDVGNYGAQIGVVVGTSDAPRDVRAEAGAPGQIPIVLLCGDALVEALTECAVGCRPIVVPEIDESFFKSAADAAQQEEAIRRARREERERREPREGREGREPRDVREGKEAPERELVEARPAAEGEVAGEEPAASADGGPPPDYRTPLEAFAVPHARIAPAAPAAASQQPPDLVGGEGEDEEGDEGAEDDSAEGLEAAEGAPGAPQPEGERSGEVRRRRRRRRRRGRARTGAAGPPGGGPPQPGRPPGPAGDTSGSAPAAAGPAPEPPQGGED